MAIISHGLLSVAFASLSRSAAAPIATADSGAASMVEGAPIMMAR